MTKLQKWKTDSGCQDLRKAWGQEGSGCGYKRATRGNPCGARNVLGFDSIKVNILAVLILY